MDKKAQIIDMVKNVTIVLLCLSAAYLLFQAINPGGTSNSLRAIFSSNKSIPPDSSQTIWSDEPTIPGIILVSTGPKTRYSIKYDWAGKEKLFSKFSSALGEALGSCSARSEVSKDIWREAVSGRGVFFDYLYDQPLSLIALGLGTTVSELLENDTSRRICISEEDGSYFLYYRSGTNSKYYRCETALNPGSLTSRLNEAHEIRSHFAFDLKDEYSTLDPYFVFSGEEISLETFASSVPDMTLLPESVYLELFDMNPRTSVPYSEPDGSMVYIDGNKTLRIDASGYIQYNAKEGDGLPLCGNGNTPSYANRLTTVGNIVSGVLNPLMGNAQIYLTHVATTPGNGAFLFNYFVNGIPVQLMSGEEAASLRVSRDSIVYARIIIRSFSSTGDIAKPLPEMQSSAIAAKNGGEPLLIFEEISDGFQYTWVSR